MKLNDGMLLYHGSYAPIQHIDLSKCAVGKDFGKGFYVTEDLDQAKSFIKNSLKKAKSLKKISKNQNYGYVSIFRYKKPEDDIPIYTFETADKEWLWFVSMHRSANLVKQLETHFNRELIDAEIVVGKIANDTTNPTIIAYLNGLYGDVESENAVDFAIHQLLPERLKNQYCFLSKRAISCLELVEVKRYEQ